MSDADLLRGGYAVLAELWCSPQEPGVAEAWREAEALLPALARADAEAADALARFLARPVAEDAYVELFELDPQCPLYLGSHAFEEPRTCAHAAMSDRNGYMIELLGIYRHFGLEPNGRELPDYLPLVVELLALTAGSDDAVRHKLIDEYVLPHLPPIRTRLETLETPYLHLLAALDRLLRLDIGAGAVEASHA